MRKRSVAEREAGGVSRRRRPGESNPPLTRRARGARQGWSLRRLRPASPRAPLGARARLPSAVGSRDEREGEAAAAPARPDRRDAAASRAHPLGADARGLPPHRALGRNAPARAPPPAPSRGTLSSLELLERPHGRHVAVAGMAVARQRPSTANGIVFMLLEDEHGQVNLIVPPAVYERHRATVRAEPLVLARGRYERVGENRNILVVRSSSRSGRLRAPSPRTTRCGSRSRGRTPSAAAELTDTAAARRFPGERDPIRAERRDRRRVSRRRRRSDRSRLRRGRVHAPRDRVGAARSTGATASGSASSPA